MKLGIRHTRKKEKKKEGISGIGDQNMKDSYRFLDWKNLKNTNICTSHYYNVEWTDIHVS